MRPLRYSINVTLDGCCDHRAFLPGRDVHDHAADGIARADAIIFGSTTYRLMEEGWRSPGAGVPDWMLPFADTISAAEKYLVSRTIEPDGWNTTLLDGDPVAAVRALKEQPGAGLLVGGIALPATLARAGLIDEYEFVVHPTVAGHGPTLLPGLDAPLRLRLVESIPFASGVRADRYAPAD
jgi:dihydrofolate reductase